MRVAPDGRRRRRVSLFLWRTKQLFSPQTSGGLILREDAFSESFWKQKSERALLPHMITDATEASTAQTRQSRDKTQINNNIISENNRLLEMYHNSFIELKSNKTLHPLLFVKRYTWFTLSENVKGLHYWWRLLNISISSRNDLNICLWPQAKEKELNTKTKPKFSKQDSEEPITNELNHQAADFSERLMGNQWSVCACVCVKERTVSFCHRVMATQLNISPEESKKLPLLKKESHEPLLCEKQNQ